MHVGLGGPRSWFAARRSALLCDEHPDAPPLPTDGARDGWAIEHALDIETMKKTLGKKVTVNGRLFPSIKAAARHYGLAGACVRDRLSRGWKLKQALELSPKPKRTSTKSKPIVVAGRTFPSRIAAADYFGINRIAFTARIYAGWPPEEAAEIEKRPGNIRASLPEARKAAKDRGGRLLVKTVRNTKDKLIWRCGCGHKFPMSLGDVRRGLWCGRCRSTIGSRGERVTRAFFETLFDAEFPSTWPAWLDGLELDGFNQSLNVAFEHQGKQHYKPVASRGGEKVFRGIQARDLKKARICKKHGVRLVIVPEIGTLLPLNELRRFILRECERLGCHVPPERQHLGVDLKDAYTTNEEIEKLAEVKTVAAELGVEILADAYFRSNYPMPARCKKCRHEWDTSAERITKRRAGCRHCSRAVVGRKNQKPVTVGGKDFPSVTAALRHYGTKKATYENRRSRGCALDACFGAVPSYLARKGEGYIVANKRFDSVADVCSHFGVSKTTYQSRRRRAFSFEVCCGAETTPQVGNAERLTVDGQSFASISEACRHFGADEKIFHSRKMRGHTIAACLQLEPLPPPPRKGPTKPLTVAGTFFPSITEACEHYGISRCVYKQRRKRGHSVEVSMGVEPLPPRPLNSLAQAITVKKKKFPTVTAACDHYGVPKVTYYRRIARGYTVEEALRVRPNVSL